MDYHKQSNGWLTFLEHWSLPIVVIIALVASQVLGFFIRLNGTPWICFFVSDLALMVFGTVMIGHAKLPVYRSGRFLTFGLKSVPEDLQWGYRWGWRIFLFGVVLASCLLLSTP